MRLLLSLAALTTLAGCTDLDHFVTRDGSGEQPPTWIYGGSAATADRHEAVVALHELEGEQIYTQPFCTGTLIRGDWVLTAAHCMGSFDRDPATLAIYVGSDPSEDLVDHAYPVSEVHVYPEYDARAISGDLALLRLPGDVAAAEGVTPVSELANVDGIINADAGAMVDLVGFGMTESGGFGVKLHVAEELGGLVEEGPSGQIWTDQRDGTGTCQGDSGGPLMIERADGWHVAGITSYGDPQCSQYGVYTHVDYYESWVKGVIDSAAPPDDPEDPPDDPEDPPEDPDDPPENPDDPPEDPDDPPADTTPPEILLDSVYVDGSDYLLTFGTHETAACEVCDDFAVCASTDWGTEHEAGWAPFTPPVTVACIDEAGNQVSIRAEW